MAEWENENQDVVVAFFAGAPAADAAIEQLKSWDKADEEVKLGNIGIISKDGDRVKTQSGRKTGTGATIGAAAVGLVAAALTGGLGLLGGVVAGGALGGAAGSFFNKSTNLPDEAIARIGEQLDSGRVAVVVACDTYEVALVREHLTASGGEVWEYAVSKAALKDAEDHLSQARANASDVQLTAVEAVQTAQDAYVFAYPMLENYRTLLQMAVLPDSPDYLGPFNQFHHKTNLLGPEFTAIVRPNNDTLYSIAWLDLRTEPLVLTVPAVLDHRYYAFQLIDLFTHNFGYVGARTTGFAGGHYLIAGPHWRGSKPDGIDQLFQSEGDLVLCLGRTAVNGAGDLPAARGLMEQYQLTPLSAFLGQPAPSPAPALNFPLYDRGLADSPCFIQYFNFLLGQLAGNTPDRATIVTYSGVGVGRNRPFDTDALTPALQQAIQEGITAGQAQIEDEAAHLGSTQNGWMLTGPIFGGRQQMQGRYLTRAAAAKLGLYGNDQEEAYYPGASTDASGNPLDASQHGYILRFAQAELPPVQGFWSISLYSLPEQLFVANPINRYSIGDRTPGLRYGEDGSLTLYIQHTSPGSDGEANWLPANAGPFSLQMRLYWPTPEALAVPYAPPAVQIVNA